MEENENVESNDQPQVGGGNEQAPQSAPASDRDQFVGKKTAAGICGILIGGLGIHKFILGLTTPAVIMLLVTVVAGILTCGLGVIPMGIIGLIEGIMYLTKSDDDFYQQYGVDKKGWF